MIYLLYIYNFVTAIIVLFLLSCLNKYFKLITLQKMLSKNNTFIISDSKIYLFKFYKYKFEVKTSNIINFENYDEIITLLKNIKGKDINFIIHTNGGDCDGADSLSYLLSQVNVYVNVYIPEYAYSAGTMIAICANKIYMNWYSLMGPVDSQVDYEFGDEYNESFSVKYIRKLKDKKWARDREILQSMEANSIYLQDIELLEKILAKNPKRKKIIDSLFSTKFSHEMIYSYKDLKKMGLPIVRDVPVKFQNIFNIYRSI